MSTINPFFRQGTSSEQNLIEDIIIESLRMYGQEVMYIPRVLVAKDEILGEDRLSKFEHAYPIEAYFENVDSFDGQGSFLQKFGLMVEQSATLVVARRRWEQLIGKHSDTIIPSRPNEGDLIYFPLSKGLFEIKFVAHQDPFYQLGKLYVYKLQVELFQYASERIDTGVSEIDIFETLKSFTEDPTSEVVSQNGILTGITIVQQGSGYTETPTIEIISNSGKNAHGIAVLEDGKIMSINLIDPGTGYTEAPIVRIHGNGTGATATAQIVKNIDNPDSYGDNNSFISEGDDIIFFENNAFGNIQ